MSAPAARVPMSLPRRAVLFAAVFVLLSALYTAARGTWVERTLVDALTVQPAAVLVNLVAPDTQAIARGSRLTAPGGGINVLNGCEGADVMFLVIAALLAAPISWRARVLGAATGLAVAFVANQARVVTLFFAARSSPEWFATLHGYVLPLMMVAAVAVWFAWFVRGRAAHGSVPMYRL